MSSWAIRDFIPIPLVITVREEYCWKNDEELKKQFAIALVNASNAFEAACSVFGKETNKALWASTNWVNDELILQTQKEFEEVKSIPKKLLDKQEFAARLLEIVEEKIIYNGNEVAALEGKDKVSALKLYAETMGFINNKTEINNNFNPKNFMEIRFVEPEKKQDVKIIDNSPVIQNEDILENSPIKLKLVG